MKEYLKMGDAFELPVTQNSGANCLYESDGFCFADLTCDTSAYYAAHAINSHDDLVAEVGRLREALDRIYSDGVNFIGAEDLEDEEDAAAMQGKFNDTLIFISDLIK